MQEEVFFVGELGGDREALDHLFSLTYEELRRVAASVRRSDPGATLSPTTLVNEAWIKLSKSPLRGIESPLHFKRLAACAMRQVLIGAARRRIALKRGAASLVDFGTEGPMAVANDDQLLAIDAALNDLAKMNPRQAAMVESRFFGGLEMREIAELLQVSEATLLRDWRAAKAWLAGQIAK
ncbi:MAG: sigma-70 family RNA polymerase sigma factor [Acidobacteria bacterium]|nr:sigma-70 family RNA polymerase sigma factor [Acidobacteriota bacterium]